MRRRSWLSLAVVLAVVAALIATVYLRKNAPPEVARLLPEADAIVYFNMTPLRALTAFDRHPVAHDPDYQAFIDATGIEFERDLDQVAMAVHRLADPTGPNGPVAYSEVFRGHFNVPRLTAYLAAQAATIDPYAGHNVYSIPHAGRTVRVVILGYDLVVVSNAPTAEQLHSMIDRYHSAASPFSGDTLLSRYYSDVPLLSEAWAIGQLALPFASGGKLSLFGLPLPIPASAPFIASVRYMGAIHLRLMEIAPSPAAAKQSAELANLALGLLRSAQVTTGAQTAHAQDWTKFLQSTKVEQQGNRAILRAVIPIRLMRDLMAARKSASTAAQVQNPSQHQ